MPRTLQQTAITAGSPRQVWKYLVDSKLLAGWLMPNDFEDKAGAQFSFLSPSPGLSAHRIECKVLSIEPQSAISFSWITDELAAPTEVVRALQSAARDQTVIEVQHSGFEDGPIADQHLANYAAAWKDHLRVLGEQIAEQARGGQKPTGEIDWSRLSLHFPIAASPLQIREMWATAKGMESFFVESMQISNAHGELRKRDEAARPGDTYVWRWHNGRRLIGEFLDGHSTNEVAFSFGESAINICCIPFRGGTVVRLTQSGIPDDPLSRMHIHANCRGGWVHFLTNLKSVVEHRIDLRDTSREMGACLSTYFDPTSIGLI